MWRKVLSGVVCVSLLLLMAGAALAAPIPYVGGRDCPNCAVGLVTGSRRTVRVSSGPAIHYDHVDTCCEYEVYYYESCNSCSYHYENLIDSYYTIDCPYE